MKKETKDLAAMESDLTLQDTERQ